MTQFHDHLQKLGTGVWHSQFVNYNSIFFETLNRDSFTYPTLTCYHIVANPIFLKTQNISISIATWFEINRNWVLYIQNISQWSYNLLTSLLNLYRFLCFTISYLGWVWFTYIKLQLERGCINTQLFIFCVYFIFIFIFTISYVIFIIFILFTVFLQFIYALSFNQEGLIHFLLTFRILLKSSSWRS